jgi:hypothetical protein
LQHENTCNSPGAIVSWTAYIRESDYHSSLAFCYDEDIMDIIQFGSVEDAILIAQTENLCLDDLSLEGDIDDDVLL